MTLVSQICPAPLVRNFVCNHASGMYRIAMTFSHAVRLRRRSAVLLSALLFLVTSFSAHAQADKKTKAKPDESKPTQQAEDKMHLPPLPADAHVEQSMQLNGKTLHYTVTVGTLPVRDTDGKEVGQVVYTAYTMDGSNRPVTFAINGGPGASSVFLNFGAIGPKHLKNMGNEGDSPSDPATLVDNPGTWLDFSDLVFIDPIGTGFSRALVPEDKA